MRIRTILLVLAILIVAAFVALNMEEFTRISTLSLGFATVQVSLGLVMLVTLAAATVIFLASALYMQSTNLLEMRKHTKELNSQRELADKAEASRFTELQNFLTTQAATQQQRQSDVDAALAESFARQQQALMARIEQSDNTLAAYIGQLQDKLERAAPMTGT
ncbi:hypothetical protein [Polaromonas sp.]|jgi:hypothetical protein|uniref:hypothetical protein n=1 Tax=Polaromonas sp. TaxID=1869339 RepID=UPI001D20084D|nr:hypothetical protein [Polaromonas sp.]MBT9475626.1 hypothetical protein [Polaromonas sp.]